MNWKRTDPGPLVKATYPGTRAWQSEVRDGHLTVLVGREPGRYPEWDEIVEARYRFIPDEARIAMLLPPRAEWVNVHPTTFHLWEIQDVTPRTLTRTR